tara:strand:- start:2703 stop:3581 length:879 start_codon:yes stop_codon:yes gene_type:complete
MILSKQIAKTIRYLIKAIHAEYVFSYFTRDTIQGETILSRLLPDHYNYNLDTKFYIKRNDIHYEICLGEHIDWYIFYGFKDVSKLILYNNIRKGNLVIDIGSNVGEVLMNISKIVGENGFVHGFEPDQENFNRLSKNLSLNKFKNIKINNKGLSNEKAFGCTEINNLRNKGMNGVSQVSSSKINETYFELIELDDYINNENITQIDLIKIDVEGFETNVIKGAQKSLSKHQPTLFIELDDNNLKKNGSNAKELILLLEKFNYVIINIITRNIITSKTNFANCHYDILCEVKK